MKASLDTNVIIHFYRANLQEILFKRFNEGLCIYEQIRKVELENHGADILQAFDKDVANGQIYIYTDDIKQGGPYMSLLQFQDRDIYMVQERTKCTRYI